MGTFLNLVSRIILFSSVLIFACCSNETTYTPPIENKDMAITYYAFGKMVVDGMTYSNELQILPNGKVKKWSPGDPHYILPTDIEEIVNSGIHTIIIGTGDVGNVGVPEETLNFLNSKGITVHELNTHKAVELFNNSPKEKLGAVFHLNC